VTSLTRLEHSGMEAQVPFLVVSLDGVGSVCVPWFPKFRSHLQNKVSFTGLFCKRDLSLWEGLPTPRHLKPRYTHTSHTTHWFPTPTSWRGKALEIKAHTNKWHQHTKTPTHQQVTPTHQQVPPKCPPFDMGWLRLVGSLKHHTLISHTNTLVWEGTWNLSTQQQVTPTHQQVPPKCLPLQGWYIVKWRHMGALWNEGTTSASQVPCDEGTTSASQVPCHEGTTSASQVPCNADTTSASQVPSLTRLVHCEMKAHVCHV